MAKTPRRRAASRPQPSVAPSAQSAVSRAAEERRPAAATSTLSSAPRPAQRRRRFNPFGWLGRFEPRFVADIIAELRKVTWPTAAETRYLTFVVAVVAVVMGLILGAFDLAFGQLIEEFFFN